MIIPIGPTEPVPNFFWIDLNAMDSHSLLYAALFDYHTNLAIFIISLAKEHHPFFLFFQLCFDIDDGNNKFFKANYPDLEKFEFEDKIRILDAIRESYDFEQKFKEDYKLTKENFGLDSDRLISASAGKKKSMLGLTVENLKIFNYYCKLRGIDPEKLFGQEEYKYLKTTIPDFDKVSP